MSTAWLALNAPRRRQILRLIWTEELCAGDIHAAIGDLTFGAISQHLRILTESGLVHARRAGRQRYYRADRERLEPLRAWLEELWSDALYELKLRAEIEEKRRGPKRRRNPERSRDRG